MSIIMQSTLLCHHTDYCSEMLFDRQFLLYCCFGIAHKLKSYLHVCSDVSKHKQRTAKMSAFGWASELASTPTQVNCVAWLNQYLRQITEYGRDVAYVLIRLMC